MRAVLTIVAAVAVVCMVGCKGKSAFAKKENTDSLFLGISLGMEKKAFYDYCWQMNKEQKFTHGPANAEVEFRMTEGVKSPVLMRFYPSFHDEKIFEMPVLYTYEAWAPWNKQFTSDSLLVDILALYKKKYGAEFKIVEHPTQGRVYVRRDDNRRINLFIRDDQFVQAVFTDVKIEKKRQDLAEGK